MNIKKWCFVLTVMLLLTSISFGQGIRKHYTELNNSERIAYKNALENLNALGVREEYAGYHADPNDDGVNGNDSGSGTSSQIHGIQVFLPWHRQFILEFERELQAENEYVTLPYWDWTGDSDPTGINSASTSGPLWDNSQISSLGWSSNFLGEYNTSFVLGRTLGVFSPLPTSNHVANILAQSSFSGFRAIEGTIHGRPHVWVGGQMSDILFSPRDPVFYFHHAMVDKLWQDWEEQSGTSSSFSVSTMPTFNGTISDFDNVNPNDVIDSKELGVFYSDPDNQLATLSGYAVTNNTMSSEKFVYQYEIEAKDNFTVPPGKDAEIKSCNKIFLKPGFKTEPGAFFKAKIDRDCDFQTGNLVGGGDSSGLREKQSNGNTLNGEEALKDNWGNYNSLTELSLKIAPNPIKDFTTISYSIEGTTEIEISIFDMNGQKVRQLINGMQDKGAYQVNFNRDNLPSGMYYCLLKTETGQQTVKLAIVD